VRETKTKLIFCILSLLFLSGCEGATLSHPFGPSPDDRWTCSPPPGYETMGGEHTNECTNCMAHTTILKF
jgi:hypothetical protein